MSRKPPEAVAAPVALAQVPVAREPVQARGPEGQALVAQELAVPELAPAVAVVGPAQVAAAIPQPRPSEAVAIRCHQRSIPRKSLAKPGVGDCKARILEGATMDTAAVRPPGARRRLRIGVHPTLHGVVFEILNRPEPTLACRVLPA